MFAKKSFGQHFLHNKHVLEKIAALVQAQAGDYLIEIGPGKGALTQYLKNLKPNFIAVEADRDMQDYLLEHSILSSEQLIKQDILKLDFNEVFEAHSFVLCGNFPYNISSQIIIKTLENANRIPCMIGMFQKEMAMRIISPPGSKEYGGLSVITQLLYHTKKCFDISPSSFTPPPKVISSVLQLTRRSDAISNITYHAVQKLVRQSFQFRRKTLRNNLKSYVQNQDMLQDPFFDRRPEELAPEEYIQLLKTLEL